MAKNCAFLCRLLVAERLLFPCNGFAAPSVFSPAHASRAIGTFLNDARIPLAFFRFVFGKALPVRPSFITQAQSFRRRSWLCFAPLHSTGRQRLPDFPFPITRPATGNARERSKATVLFSCLPCPAALSYRDDYREGTDARQACPGEQRRVGNTAKRKPATVEAFDPGSTGQKISAAAAHAWSNTGQAGFVDL